AGPTSRPCPSRLGNPARCCGTRRSHRSGRRPPARRRLRELLARDSRGGEFGEHVRQRLEVGYLAGGPVRAGRLAEPVDPDAGYAELGRGAYVVEEARAHVDVRKPAVALLEGAPMAVSRLVGADLRRGDRILE